MFAVKIRSGVTNALFKRSVSDYGTPYTAKNRLEERERVLKNIILTSVGANYINITMDELPSLTKMTQM